MLNQLIHHLTQKQQRCLLWVKGEQRWAQAHIKTWLSEASQSLKTIWFGDLQTPPSTTPLAQNLAQTQNQITDIRIKQYKKMLGQESDVLIYDCYAGLNPDALGALVGTVKQGGLCIIVSPEIPQWLDYVDPEYNRLCVEPFKPEQISNHYLQYLIGQLTQSKTVLTISQSNKDEPKQVLKNWLEVNSITNNDISINGRGSDISGVINTNPPYNLCKTHDQYKAVKQLLESCNLGKAGFTNKQSVVIQSDRGRGKSASLGLFAGLLLADSRLADSELLASKEQIEITKSESQQSINIVLTAPHASSVTGVFHFCEIVLKQLNSNYSINNNKLTTNLGSLTYISPDELVTSVAAADVVLVDEAAAIPSQMLLPVLSKNTEQAKCAFVVFATTIHGYEGTGRGFEYKFKPLLAKTFDAVTHLSLSQPIRWSEHDFLEADINKLLMINTQLPTLTQKDKLSINSENVSFTLLSSPELIKQTDKLASIFGLLVNAHYRTTPNDLRNMLDGPNMKIFSLQYNGVIIGAVLLAAEGKIESELTEQIWQGRRRPKGHLLPQSLIAHSGFKQAGEYRYGRIVRIAIHPDLQGKGFGSVLLNNVKQAITQQGFDFIGTSFGVADNLVRFWISNQYVPVRLGLKAEASTGEYSLLMTQALNQGSQALQPLITTRFQQTLVIEQQLNMRSLLSVSLLKQLQTTSLFIGEYSEQDAQDILCFCHHHRSLDTCLLAMKRHINWRLLSDIPDQVFSPLILDKVINGLENKTLIQKYKLSGEKQLVQTLRNEWLIIMDVYKGN